jgi:hypothetical protein
MLVLTIFAASSLVFLEMLIRAAGDGKREPPRVESVRDPLGKVSGFILREENEAKSAVGEDRLGTVSSQARRSAAGK